VRRLKPLTLIFLILLTNSNSATFLSLVEPLISFSDFELVYLRRRVITSHTGNEDIPFQPEMRAEQCYMEFVLSA
jgi:hypothetical protein